jgi:polysaccharide export outer membrane protein
MTIRLPLLIFWLIVLPGCRCPCEEVRQELTHGKPVADPRVTPALAYRVGCPDVLIVAVAGKPEWGGRREVQPSGCIDLGSLGAIRVEGLTTDEVRARIAAKAQLRLDEVQVEVAEYRSQKVYLFGEVTGQQRAVPYQGPETVTELLRRAGGITRGSEPGQIRIVRNPLLEKAEPEVLHVDLHAILVKGDQRTNVLVQPFDQIYVPESRQARVGRCLHPWLRPLSKMVAGPEWRRE